LAAFEASLRGEAAVAAAAAADAAAASRAAAVDALRAESPDKPAHRFGNVRLHAEQNASLFVDVFYLGRVNQGDPRKLISETNAALHPGLHHDNISRT
jgi:hypothetical protein